MIGINFAVLRTVVDGIIIDISHRGKNEIIEILDVLFKIATTRINRYCS